MITVGYEQSRGLRVKHETTSGFSVSASRTLPVPIADAFEAWHDNRKRAQWLDDDGRITVRRATENRSMRITWADGRTSLEVMFYVKGKDKCQVTVQHSKLKDEKIAAKMKKYWGERMDALADFLV
jgi:hypothetical protein